MVATVSLDSLSVKCGQLSIMRNSQLGLSTNSIGVNNLHSVYSEAVPIYTPTVTVAVGAYQITR